MKTTIEAIDARAARLKEAAEAIRAAVAREAEALAEFAAALAARDAMANASEAALAQLEPAPKPAEAGGPTVGEVAPSRLVVRGNNGVAEASIPLYPVHRPGKRPVMVSVPPREEDEPLPAPAKRGPGRNGRAGK